MRASVLSCSLSASALMAALLLIQGEQSALAQSSRTQPTDSPAKEPNPPIDGEPAELEQAEEAPEVKETRGQSSLREIEEEDPSLEESLEALPEEVAEAAAVKLERQRHRRHRWKEFNIARELPARADVLSLTVAGGVSLGAYEAGMIHLLTEALRRSPDSAKLRVVSGASAGSANALVGATEACMVEVPEPERSLGYRVWVSVGLDELFQPEQVTKHSVFSRKALERSLGYVQEEMSKLPEGCDFVYGVTATRQHGYDVELAPGLVVPRLAEHFAVHVQGRGNASPLFENFLDPQRSFERPVLPFSDGTDLEGNRDFKSLWQITKASAAFPVAFDAEAVEYCTTSRRLPMSVEEQSKAPEDLRPPQCEVATRIDSFVDGGVFDNSPLGLAYDMATEGLLPQGRESVFREVPTGGHEHLPEVVYGYIDPSIRTYPTYHKPVSRKDENEDPLLGLLTRLSGQAINSARGQELANLAENNPRALERLWLLESSYAPVSELLSSFFGFFEHDVRDFDFHLGSYQSYRDLRDHSGTMLGVDPFLDHMELILAGQLEDIPDRYRKMGCIIAHAEPDRHGRLAPLCEGAKLKNFRVLLQVTIDRLWANCRQLGDDVQVEHEHLQCKRARGGLQPPQVDPKFVVTKGHRFRSARESEFDYVMRLFTAYEFEFKDLGLSASKARLGRREVRRRLGEIVSALGDAQPRITDRTVVLSVGRMLVNQIEYQPPVDRGYLLLGSALAAGYLGRIGKSSVPYFNLDARINNLRTLVTARPDQFAGALSVGVEWAILPLSGTFLQTSFGVRGGYQFAITDSIGAKTCDPSKVNDDNRYCSQPLIHVPFNLTLLERVRFNITPVFYPVPEKFDHNVFDLELGFGGELY